MTRVDPLESSPVGGIATDCTLAARRPAASAQYSGAWSGPNVACWLNTRMTEHVRTFFPRARGVASTSELRRVITSLNTHLIIADPALDERMSDTLQELRTAVQAVLVVYTTLTPSVVSDLIRLASAGIDEVIFFGTDDTPARFIELGARAVANPLVVQAQRLLSDRIQRLPDALRDAVILMLHAPRRFRTVDDLAAAAYMTRRALYRHLATVGINSPRLLLLSARVLRAIPLLREPSRSLREVAATLGYSKPERLSDQIAFFTGSRPRQLAAHSSLTEIVERVVGRL